MKRVKFDRKEERRETAVQNVLQKRGKGTKETERNKTTETGQKREQETGDGCAHCKKQAGKRADTAICKRNAVRKETKKQAGTVN